MQNCAKKRSLVRPLDRYETSHYTLGSSTIQRFYLLLRLFVPPLSTGSSGRVASAWSCISGQKSGVGGQNTRLPICRPFTLPRLLEVSYA
jgi:hypothetical protein